MSPALEELTALRNEWQTAQPLAAEAQDRLWRKLRLEWNYHSNHIEGNTLTYGETELFLLHDRTSGHHSHREYIEMKAHDAAIEHIREISADRSRVITEADIRELNQIILKEPFWKPAETPDGRPTRKEIIPGRYKTSPNNVRTASGDVFYFASVEDTPPRMQRLVERLQSELTAPQLHPVEFAAWLHHEFVLIHPFDDGNGRVARLLVNCVLMRAGYPPVIVPSENKARYLDTLRLADAGDILPLTRYLAELEKASLHLGLKASRGEAVEEPSDVEKELAVFIRNQGPHPDPARRRSPEAIGQLLDHGLRTLLERIDGKMRKLAPLFVEMKVSGNLMEDLARIVESGLIVPCRVTYLFKSYSGGGTQPFDISSSISIEFRIFDYQITADGETVFERPYNECITAGEVEALSAATLAKVFSEIKARNRPLS